MNAVYHQALEDLAEKRRSIGALIVSLAAVAGVDPAPYLEADTAAADLGEQARDAVRRLHDMQDTTTKAKPPRPPRPASPATNGTGRAHKVTAESAHAPAILKALAGGPKSPGELGELLHLTPTGAMYHVKQLESAGKVAITGERSTRRVALA